MDGNIRLVMRAPGKSSAPIRQSVLLSLVFLMTLPAWSPAATRQIAAPWSASAVNSAIASASDGDVIELTGSGTVAWNDTIRIDGKGITLRVAGGTNTPKSAAIFPIVVTSNRSPAILINTAANKSVVRISGFRFLNPSPESGADAFIHVTGMGRGSSNAGAYRIDNNYFDTIRTSACIALAGADGEQTGLIDNNTFHDHTYGSAMTVRVREDWTGGHATCYGHDSWVRLFLFGSNRFHFIEDNLFEHTGSAGHHDVVSDGSGGRYVVRYNTFSNTYPNSEIDYIDAHGDGTQGLGTGARGGEIYNNTFLGTGSSVGRNMNIRGGQWLIFNNTFTTLGYGLTAIHFTEYRAWSAACGQLQNPSLCNPGVPQCATAAHVAAWYPLPGQIRGSYLWNNLHGGVNQAPYLPSEPYLSTYLQEGRDYWVCASLADAKSKGLSVSYTPYTYPHPLTQGSQPSPAAVAPPQNLRIVGYQ
jgi:hypothetical protein